MIDIIIGILIYNLFSTGENELLNQKIKPFRKKVVKPTSKAMFVLANMIDAKFFYAVQIRSADMQKDVITY